MKKLNVACIGTGGIVNSHMPGWAESPYAQVVMGCDIYEPSVKAWGAKYGVTNLTTNVQDVLGNPDIDVVDICTPNMLHTDLTIAALNAGKHVLCEKPLAPSPDDIRKMIAARDANGKMLMTAQHFRFSGTSQAMKAEINSGALGEIYHARSWMLRRNFLPTRPTFVHKELSGGGVCIDIGVHILDLTLWFMGNPKPLSVSGTARTILAKKPGAFSAWDGGVGMPERNDVEELATAFVRFENGASLILEVSWMLHHDVPNPGSAEDMQMWLYGTDGGAQWPKCEVYSSNNITRQHYNKQLRLTRDKNEAHKQEVLDFAKALADGAPSPVPAEQSLQVMTILNAVYRSQTEGREVQL